MGGGSRLEWVRGGCETEVMMLMMMVLVVMVMMAVKQKSGKSMDMSRFGFGVRPVRFVQLVVNGEVVADVVEKNTGKLEQTSSDAALKLVKIDMWFLLQNATQRKPLSLALSPRSLLALALCQSLLGLW